jgi:hypothetical protein
MNHDPDARVVVSYQTFSTDSRFPAPMKLRKGGHVRDESVGPFQKPPESGPEGLELLWIVRQDSHSWSGELQFRGEFYGWDALIRRDGALVLAQRFLVHS